MISRITLTLQLISFWLYENYTNGLSECGDGERDVLYCNDLMSSGGEDSIMVTAAWIFYVLPWIVSWFKSRRLLIGTLIFAIVAQYFFFLMVQVCDPISTLFCTFNVPLFLIIILPIALLIFLTSKPGKQVI
ncbi:hypothetical protein [Fulvivirga lutimaris]|uniref:hypothetical protein n=1 Tax=Fulvivirga lutimaris TaxID=1819566 RepID=UPI0012BD0C87|nr:hypothetical protein [Fulvivirga lutimaris]MTI41154.1 hypothetical protein [Fulvivirga lutimaris]